MDTIQSESLGVTLDTANFHLYGIDPAKAIDVLNRRIFHTHLKDYALKDGEGSIFKRYMGKPVGEGILNFPEIIKKLKEHDYRGAYCFEYGGEYSPEEGIRRGMNYLSKVMEELGS